MDIKAVFTTDSSYKKRARVIAIIWTLLIFIACFTPSKEIPKVDIPLIDKWTHFVLFGGFAFLWLCAYPGRGPVFRAFIFFLSLAMGSFIEMMQGILSFLGRSCELLDAVADGIGGLMGVLLFYAATRYVNKKIRR